MLSRAPGFLNEFVVDAGKVSVTTIYFDKFLEEIQQSIVEEQMSRRFSSYYGSRTTSMSSSGSEDYRSEIDAATYRPPPLRPLSISSKRNERGEYESSSEEEEEDAKLEQLSEHIGILTQMRRRASSRLDGSGL